MARIRRTQGIRYRREMVDLLYIIGTLTFFALMLAYVAGCARLGRAGGDIGSSKEPRP